MTVHCSGPFMWAFKDLMIQISPIKFGFSSLLSRKCLICVQLICVFYSVSFSNHASTIQTSHRVYDSKRISQAHTRKATLCEGDKGRSGKRCKSHHSNNRWAPSQRGRSLWFNHHTAGGYTTFEQFRNGHYYYSMPHQVGLGAMMYDRKSWRNTYTILMQILN